ncbi:MAG: hypothetical protein R6W76_13275, partial [Caldilinea sp.]
MVKIPRWTFEKFPETQDILTTAMKSVGETMSIGRTFKEAFQKGLRSLEIGRYGFGADGKDPAEFEIFGEDGCLPEYPQIADLHSRHSPMPAEIRQKLAVPNSQRIFYLRYALLSGMSVDEIYEITKIDPWFICQMQHIVN